MANKLIVTKTLKHYYDEGFSGANPNEEPDKSKSISELTQNELQQMLRRIGSERELQQMIRDMKRSAGEKDSYENPMKVDTKTPINQLYHYGILGMKWGVRRYQNPDGTRTPTGKKREREEVRKSDDYMKSRIDKAKSPAGLSNDELRKLNERLQLEESYKRLTAAQMEQSESWVKKSLEKAGQDALADFAKSMFLGAAKTLVKELSPEFAETAFTKKK